MIKYEVWQERLGQIGLPGGGIGFGYSATNFVGGQFTIPPAVALPQGKNPVSSFIPVARISDLLLHPNGTFDFDGKEYNYPETNVVIGDITKKEIKKSDKDFLKDASIIIWTTTPWTIPANKALAYNKDINYSVLELDNKKIVVAEKLVNSVYVNSVYVDKNKGTKDTRCLKFSHAKF